MPQAHSGNQNPDFEKDFEKDLPESIGFATMTHREGGVPKFIVSILVICTAKGHSYLPVALLFRKEAFEDPARSASEFIILLSCSTIWPAIVD